MDLEQPIVADDNVPILDIDPYAVEALVAPYDIQALIRETAPVVFIPKYGVYASGRYDTITAILENPVDFPSSPGAGLADLRKPGERPASPIVEVDPPQHTAVRAPLQKILSLKIVKGWRTDFDTEAAKLVERICEKRSIDGVHDVTEPFITTVFPHALGMQTDARNFIILGNHLFNSHGPQNELFFQSKRELDSIADWANSAQDRESFIPGGFAEEVFRAEDEGLLPAGTARRLMLTFLRGGMDTTISALGTMLLHLSRQPETWQQLRANRSRAKLAFEEAMRIEAPTPTFFRTTAPHSVILEGFSLKPETKMQMFIGAGNRDPRKWIDPDRFNVDRPMLGHLSLGRGIHACIGQMIARTEAESLLLAMLDKIERIEPTGEPVYRPLNGLRTLDALPLNIIPA